MRSLTTATVCTGTLLLGGCAEPSGSDHSTDITSAWKRYFTADDQPTTWRSLAEVTEQVRLDDEYLSIDGEISSCSDARGYWLMGLEWRHTKNTELSRFITVYSDGELAGDTTTSGEFDCHL